MTDAPKLNKMAAFLASAPAAVPAPWRWELVLVAAETAMFALTRSSSLRSLAWLVPAQSVGKALLAVRHSVERPRARELGAERVADLPPALQRLPPVVLPVRLLNEGALAPVLVRLHPIKVAGATLLVAAVATALRDRRGRPPTPGRWEVLLAYKIASALLRRWEWRTAGGPR